MASWQASLYDRLRDREWHKIGDLFDELELQIPLHFAMRHYMNPGRNRGRTELPPNSEARWRLFLSRLSSIGIETDRGSNRGLKYPDRVRITYVAGQQCECCHGPVIKKSWKSYKVTVCLACEAAAAAPAPKPVPAPQPAPQTQPQPAPEKPAFFCGDNYVKASRYWVDRASRAFAEWVKRTRRSPLSVTKIQRIITGRRTFVIKPPLSQYEMRRWLAEYCRTHPP